MSKLKLFNRNNNGVTYADPADPNYQVRFKHTQSRKSLSGQTVDNHIAEIIISDLNPVQIGNTSVNDSLSVRIRVSGSGLSEARLNKIFAAIATDISGWNTDKVFLGFEPATAPTKPE